VANALFVWEMARAGGAQVLLRIEDHDRERSRPEFERALLDDLDWLGFEPAIFPTEAFRAGPCEGRQSDRASVYRAATERLTDQGLVYGCTCSRRDIAAGAPTPDGAESRYLGTCRDRGLTPDEGLTWRVRMDPGLEHFDDRLLGAHVQDPSAQCGDVAIRDRRGNWTYQFVATVDDLEQHIDLVVRGRDLLDSTGRQLRLARLLGRGEPATFAHHPLIMRTPSHKLSKADGDTGVRDLRADGWSARRVIDAAARSVGLSETLRALEGDGASA
jgi:glutamyl/glutaminyl-tRNA synthetase